MFKITYKLAGIGWAECEVGADGEGKARVTASYLGDALGDLARAVLELRDGARASRCSFDEEPGEYRWLFTRSGDRADVRILWFEELWGKQPDEDGREVFHAAVGIDELSRAMAVALQVVLDTHGVRGYHAAWVQYRFPVREYRRLVPHRRRRQHR